MHKPHRPPHYYFDDKIYFITAKTIDKKMFFDNDEKKNILKNIISETSSLFHVKIYAWTILDNHYHFLVYILKGQDLSDLIGKINGKSSFMLNKIENVQQRKIWSNYWDTCIRTEKDFWMRFNYIHHNCVKHKYSDQMSSYKFSSYKAWVEKSGLQWTNDVFEKYSIVDFTPSEDE